MTIYFKLFSELSEPQKREREIDVATNDGLTSLLYDNLLQTILWALWTQQNSPLPTMPLAFTWIECQHSTLKQSRVSSNVLKDNICRGHAFPSCTSIEYTRV